MPSFADGAPFESLDEALCVFYLKGQTAGRLILTHRALPEVVPVNHHVLGRSTVLLGVPDGDVVAKAIRNAVVAFNADHVDAGTRGGWTVTVVGRIQKVDDAAERAEIAARLPPPTWPTERHQHVLGVTIEQISGRRWGPTPLEPVSDVRSDRPAWRDQDMKNSW